jgi:hypothetical protein
MRAVQKTSLGRRPGSADGAAPPIELDEPHADEEISIHAEADGNGVQGGSGAETEHVSTCAEEGRE